MCRRRRFENAKIVLGQYFSYACEYQTTQPIIMKFSEIFYAYLSCAIYTVNIKVCNTESKKDVLFRKWRYLTITYNMLI